MNNPIQDLGSLPVDTSVSDVQVSLNRLLQALEKDDTLVNDLIIRNDELYRLDDELYHCIISDDNEGVVRVVSFIRFQMHKAIHGGFLESVLVQEDPPTPTPSPSPSPTSPTFFSLLLSYLSSLPIFFFLSPKEVGK